MGFLYFLFSVRLGRISEKTKNSGISKELYDNIELVIRYLDTTVETVNQKTEAFYRLVQRANTLKQEFEQLIQESEKKSKRKKKSIAQEVITQDTSSQSSATNSVILKQDSSPFYSKDANSVAERLLNQQTETDRFEFSSSTGDLAQLIGAQKNRSTNQPATAEGFLTGIGKLTRRIFGLPLVPLSTKEVQEKIEPSNETRSLRKDYPIESQPNYASERSRPHYSGDYATGMPINEKQIYPARSNQTSGQQLTSNLASEAITLNLNPNQTNQQNDYEALIYHQATNKYTDIEIPDLNNPKERADFIRLLLRKPMGVDEISTLTGISLGEIQFVQKVMVNTKSRHKR
mgnify:FL=1